MTDEKNPGITLFDFSKNGDSGPLSGPQGSSESLQKSALILGFSGPRLVTDRLQEFGMHSGLMIRYVGRAPFQGPLLYRMGATVVALREEEAQCILINPL